MAKDAGGKWYPLHSALIFGDLPSAKSLFEKGCSDAGMLVTSNSKGWRALHFATQSGYNESVEWLLSLEGCDAAARTAKGETALHLSALRGDERVCQTLIDGGCPPEAVTREGKTALHLAAAKGHLAVTRFLVVGAGLSPSTPDGGGASAAALALAGNHKSVVRLLQKNCPGVSMRVPKRSNNSRRSLDAAGLLPSSELAGGSGFQGRKGRRNLRAREGGVIFGGDGGGRGKGGGGKRGGAKAAEEAGRRLLEASRVGDTLAMGRVLASGDVDVEWVGRGNGWTAVMEAAEHGSLEAVSFLLDKGADLERTNNKGLTPLQLAVRSGHLGVTEELLIRGARPNVTTKAGLCLRCLANSMGHGYLADWLFAMGVADGVDGGCACSGGAKSAGGGDDEPASSANAAIARQHSGGSAHSNGGAPSPPAAAAASSETGAPTAELTEWLASLGLSAYESRLVSEGFDTLDAMCAATEPDLEAMGFKKGHLRLLLARAPSASTLTTTANGGGGDRRLSFGDDRGARAGSPPVAVASAPHDGGGGGGGWVNPTEVVAQPVTRGVGDEDKEETDPRYCDAWVLQPSRALSAGESSGGDRARSSSSAAEGFKELKPEEVEVDHVIGEGSFGVVRRARWRGMEVAVKELKTCIASAAAVAAASGAAPSVAVGGGDSNGATAGTELGGKVKQRDIDNLVEGQEEMRHEARMLAKVCNHNCVVQFVGVLLRPVPSVVTMFMENGSVEDMLVSSDKKATKDLVCRMAIEAAKGVIHLHRQAMVEGVVHRDLASRNLLLDDGFHVRISDFGFSRVKRECASRGYTRSDMGPIKWTSPEAMRKRCYSEASDAFSFGVVLYEMFARSPPWEGHENLDVAFRVCSGERMTVPPRVDAPLADLMHKCWSESSRLRPDFASILTALTAFAGDQELARANGVEGGGAAALVEADPSPPPPPAPRDGKKSAAAVKIARAKAEAAELANAAVAELRRRKLTTLRALTELQRQGPGYTAAESEEVSAQQQGRRRRDGGGAAVAGARGRRHSLRREASGQRAAAAAAGPLSAKAGGGGGGGGGEGAASAEPEATEGNSGASRLSRQGSEGSNSGGGGGRGTDGRGRGGVRPWNGDGSGGGRLGTARGGGLFEGGRGGGWGRSGKGRSFPPRGGSTSTAGRGGRRFGGRGDGGRGPLPGGAAAVPSGNFAGPPPPSGPGEGQQGRGGGRGGRFSVDR
ncbi:unnamed protein product [Ectocarpus sp. 12 AP-2014]